MVQLNYCFSSLICNNSLLPFLISVLAIVILPSLKASLLAQHGKQFACNVGNAGSIPGSGRSPGGENGYPLKYSWLENSMDRGAWQVTVHGVSHIPDTENLCIRPLFPSVWLQVYQFCWSSQRASFLFNWFLLFYIYICACVYVYVCIYFGFHWLPSTLLKYKHRP